MLEIWWLRIASLILIEIDWFRNWRKIYHWSKSDREMSPIPHKLNWTGCMRSFRESGKGRISKRPETMASQKIYFLLCLTFFDSRLWKSTPGWQPQGVCIQKQSLWVVLAVFAGFCWWGQSGRCRRLSLFFLIFDASLFYWQVFLCWVFRFLIRSEDLAVAVNLLLWTGLDYLKVGWLSGICLIPRGRQRLWVVCSRVSQCLQWLLLRREI